LQDREQSPPKGTVVRVELTALEWAVIQNIRSLRYGQVTVKVQDGKIVRGERTDAFKAS